MYMDYQRKVTKVKKKSLLHLFSNFRSHSKNQLEQIQCNMLHLQESTWIAFTNKPSCNSTINIVPFISTPSIESHTMLFCPSITIIWLIWRVPVMEQSTVGEIYDLVCMIPNKSSLCC